jgi:hypothetical protein
MTEEAGDAELDYTANGVEFASWETVVQDDDLQLVGLSFRSGSWVRYPNEGFRLDLPEAESPEQPEIEATFLSREKRAAVRFRFAEVAAFRVLGEEGLLEMWEASKDNPRPASSTFRVRGHQWQAESFLVWFHGADDQHFSYMVATDSDCLEVVATAEPVLEMLPAVVTQLSADGQ